MSRLLVIDASIVVDLLARARAEPLEKLLFAPDTLLAAPEILDVEVLNALRKLDRSGAIPASRLNDLPLLISALRIRKYRHASLLNGIWSLRHNLTAYDAAYVTLARALDAALVTRDERLAHAPGLQIATLSP